MTIKTATKAQLIEEIEALKAALKEQVENVEILREENENLSTTIALLVVDAEEKEEEIFALIDGLTWSGMIISDSYGGNWKKAPKKWRKEATRWLNESWVPTISMCLEIAGFTDPAVEDPVDA